MSKKDKIRLILASILFILSLIFATVLVLVAVNSNLPKAGMEAIMAVSGIFSGIFLVVSLVMYYITWDELDTYSR